MKRAKTWVSARRVVADEPGSSWRHCYAVHVPCIIVKLSCTSLSCLPRARCRARNRPSISELSSASGGLRCMAALQMGRRTARGIHSIVWHYCGTFALCNPVQHRWVAAVPRRAVAFAVDRASSRHLRCIRSECLSYHLCFPLAVAVAIP